MSSYIIPFIALAIYFFPTWLAGHRQHHNTGAIFALDLLLGWTVMGWIASLVWACTAVKPRDGNEESSDDIARRIIPGWVSRPRRDLH